MPVFVSIKRNQSVVACAALLICAPLVACAPRSLGSYGLSREPVGSDAGADDASSAPDAATPERDAGTAGDPECEKTSDCNDGNPCHGFHECVNHACVERMPPCHDADDVDCDTCVALDAQRCVTVARDGDSDGHQSAACAAALQRGDDCDDHATTVHPGATELCDGVDNDCNGLIDLQDGLMPAGSNAPLASGRYPAAAWSSTGAFGVTYENGGIQFRTLDVHGVSSGEPSLVADVSDDLSARFRPDVAWGHDAFGVTWTRAAGLGFRRFSAQGQPLGDAVQVAPGELEFRNARVAPVGTDRWSVAYESVVTPNSDGVKIELRTIDAQDQVLSPVAALADPSASVFGLAPLNGQVGALWTRLDYAAKSSSLGFAVHTDDLASDSAAPIELQQMGGTGMAGPAALAASSDGFGVVWHEMSSDSSGTRSVRFAELDADGHMRCGPLTLNPYFPANSGLMWINDLVATPRGFAVSVLAVPEILSSASAVDVIELLSGCHYGQRFRIADSWANPWPTLASAGDGSLLVLWQLEDNGNYTVMQRALPPRFCQ
jgi:hypothetical protein